MFMKTMLRIFGLSLIILALIGCDTTGVSPDEDVVDGNVSLSMGVPSTTLNRITATQAIDVSSVRLLLEEVKLKTDVGDSADFKIGPLVVDLNLVGSVTEIGVGSIPPGSYDKLEFKVKKVDSDDVDSSDTQFADFIGTETSVIIVGTYNSNAFTLRIEEEFEKEIEFLIPIDILSDTSLSNLTLLVNTDAWFVDIETGVELDPTDSNNLSKIIENMDQSFKAYEDEDEDGEMEFEGTVSAVDIENSNFSMDASGVTVETDSATIFNGTIMSLDSVKTLLAAGSTVKVNGSGGLGTGVSILASEVEFEIDS